MKFHQPGPSSLSTLDLNANVNIGRLCRRQCTGDNISSSVLRTGELKMDTPEKLATLVTQNTGQIQTKQKTICKQTQIT